MKGIGNDLVREARKRVGWTQQRLADAAGTTQSSIARLESGRTSPAFDDVLRLLRLMGMDLDLMLVERDDSDWQQAKTSWLPLSPEQRHDQLLAWTRTLDDLRDDYRNSVA
ncbi:helix-turn-helix domain-containing protein [Galbitalea sp. SE-J8]|uniref:helix-turn-helix domain-containing protein n=1 Tax=Galbitalea sp. SE-J8 TaxID=3054952 RepID=UPI00259C8A9B|nr:helix-turn-helix domain-containing protein [Galbitalea sp. SE-J8]MDM4762928.1 helix-turn-helix domain-containing protein [Galbitalea sp. SE-J8]